MQMNRTGSKKTVSNHSGPTRMAPLALLLLVLASLPKVLAGDEDQPVNDKPPESAVNQSQLPKSEAPIDTNTAQDKNATQESRVVPAAPSPVTAAEPVKEFIPSETIGADSAVSFPVDI
jgi:hypothetical protein